VPFKEVDEALLGAIENRASKCNISTGEMVARLCKDQPRRRGYRTGPIAPDNHRISFDLSETAYSIEISQSWNLGEFSVVARQASKVVLSELIAKKLLMPRIARHKLTVFRYE
jgi:hypothetical protein